MNQKHLFFTILLLVSVIVSGCGPSAEQAATMTAASWTATPTAAPTAMPTATPTDAPTATITPTPAPGETQVSEKDGMVMVYVPAGNFSMGSNDSTADEQPVHTVDLDAYWIDRTEVTNGMYSLCVEAGDCQRPKKNNSNTHYNYYSDPLYANYPVIFVNWNDAQKYCSWAGRRLPTEAEWERAARGTDGRTYPWGNGSPSNSLLNFNNPMGDTTGVGSYSSGASPYGVLDMAGNVSEWVADWYDVGYYGSSPSSNPTGPATGQYRVLRGGSWYSDEYLIRSADRHWLEPDKWDLLVGFRCALASP
jgi:formylglycine-generating enzyme required for sulfatase activity